MSDAHRTLGDVTLQGFGAGKQADAHVAAWRRWRLEDWFWSRFADDALEGAAPPREWWSDVDGR